MRVIAGTRKSLPLKTVPGMNTRPTTDRIKETLFNMLQPYLPGCRFLDLFAGSGAIGIEALSRGAADAVFVEQNRRAAECIRENLSFTRLAEQAQVLQTDARAAVELLGGQGPFGCIFMDPPYDRNLEKEVLVLLSESGCADCGTLIVAEASLHTDFSYLEACGYRLEKEKRYKTNKHMFIRKIGARTPGGEV